MAPLPVRRASRIVSLVPSWSEALFALGLGERVVGVTEWCVHPRESVARLPKVGGTKTPDLERIRALAPDLVVAAKEENRKSDVRAIEGWGVPVWVSDPRTVRDGAAGLAALAELGASAARVAEVIDPVHRAIEAAHARAADAEPTAVFCPIWRDPWMSVGPDTYAHDLITLCGGRNVFAHRGAERRYPHVSLAEVVAARPELVLLPDEPYAFGEPDRRELARLEIPAASAGRIHVIDGTWVTWYGPRIARAVQTLAELFQAVGGSARK